MATISEAQAQEFITLINKVGANIPSNATALVVHAEDDSVTIQV